MRIGLISDTHGLLRTEALEAFSGVEQIVHAGDIGGPDVVEALRSIAPVHAIRGNIDKGSWALAFPQRLGLRLAGVDLYVLHDVNALDLDPAAAGFRVVVTGHSHRPSVSERVGVLYVNPGSAGPRRFNLPVTVAELNLAGDCPKAEIRTLL